jgi:serine protease Do
MRSSLRTATLATAIAVATSAITFSVATAQSPAPTPPPPQMVAGLPDFTHLVEQVGPAVVSVEAEAGRRGGRTAQLPDDAEIPEIFRRFFGPGMPMPGAPRGPGGRGFGTSMGTGFIISADGYVLTNHHVVEGADEVRITLNDRREFIAKVVGSDQPSDVALLKIDATGLPFLRTGDSRALKPGQWVVAIGSPFGLDQSVTAGVVSAVGRANPYANQQYVPFIQTDVAINRGNSGGPLLDTRGQVVGINSQIFSNSGGYMGVSFAIPIDVAMNSVNQLKATGRVSRGQIGVGIDGISRDAAQALGLDDTRGALVNSIQPGSAAQKAGIQRMDVIREFNGVRIDDASDLPPMVGALAPGSRATVSIIRDGKPRELTLVLGEAEAPMRSIPASIEEPAARHRNPLGIVGEDLSDAERDQLGLEGSEGVAIARIEGLAARSAGLRPGDVILAVGRKSVGSADALDRELSALEAGQTAMLLVRRGTGTQYVAITPRERQ